MAKPRVASLVLAGAGAVAGAVWCIWWHKRTNSAQPASPVMRMDWLPGPLQSQTSIVQVAPDAAQETPGCPDAVTYDWAQSFEDVLVDLQLPTSCKSRSGLEVVLKPKRLSVLVNGTVLLDGELAGCIAPDDSTWELEGTAKSGGKHLLITLAKAREAYEQCSNSIGDYTVWPTLMVERS